MKVIIAGGRDFNDYDFLLREVDKILVWKYIDIEIVSGTANGTDKLGERYASEWGFPVKQFPANWGLYGKSAGYIRNEEMAKYSELLIAFWDGKSKGTKHMIDLANKHGLKVEVINY